MWNTIRACGIVSLLACIMVLGVKYNSFTLSNRISNLNNRVSELEKELNNFKSDPWRVILASTNTAVLKQLDTRQPDGYFKTNEPPQFQTNNSSYRPPSNSIRAPQIPKPSAKDIKL